MNDEFERALAVEEAPEDEIVRDIRRAERREDIVHALVGLLAGVVTTIVGIGAYRWFHRFEHFIDQNGCEYIIYPPNTYPMDPGEPPYTSQPVKGMVPLWVAIPENEQEIYPNKSNADLRATTRKGLIRGLSEYAIHYDEKLADAPAPAPKPK